MSHPTPEPTDASSLWTRIVARIAKWVTQKIAYRAGIRDELRNKPLRQYRDPSLQVAYMFGRVEVREDHQLRSSD